MVIASVFFLQAGNGLQTDLIGIRADMEAFPAAVIGLMMAAYYAGYTLAPLAGRQAIGHLGHTRAIVLCAIAAGAVIAVHPLAVTAPAWTAFRFASGFVLSLAYVGYESWINDRVPNALRGRVFSLYLVAQMVAATLVQGLLNFGDARTAGPFLLAAVLFVLAAAPIAPARAPVGAPPKPLGIPKLFRLSPLGTGATALAGLSWAIVFTFGPIYARHVGFQVGGVGLFMGLAMAAGAALQLPLGWLSDIVGRRPVLALMFGGGLLAALFGIWAGDHGRTANLVAIALAGGFTFPIYAVAVAHVNDSIAPDTRVAAAAGLVLLFGLGSLFGPLLTGWAMTAAGTAGFFALIAAAMAAGAALVAAGR